MKLDLQIPKSCSRSILPPEHLTLKTQAITLGQGNLPEQGFYEFVVVSTASEPVDYQLKITTENFTSAPSDEPSPPDTPSPLPTEAALSLASSN